MSMKTNIKDLPAHIHIAQYNKDQPIKEYRNHPCIEALPPALSEMELFESLMYYPPFDEADRELGTHLRIQLLLGLLNFMHPMSDAIQLGMTLDSWLRSGYLGRRPNSRGHAAITQAIYDEKTGRVPHRQDANTVTTQQSAALLGTPGTGKSTTIARLLSKYPQVIYHPDLDTFQVTYMYYQVPADGMSSKALATEIITKLDELIPGSNYVKEFVQRGRPGADTLMFDAAQLLNKHFVGLLIPDEVQHVNNAKKGNKTLVAELSTLSNRCRAPQIWVGTHEVKDLLKSTLMQGRRSINLGLGVWDPLPRWDFTAGNEELTKVEGEFVEFMHQIWTYLWVRNPVPLTPALMDVFYRCTQGVIDLIIKLFVLSQVQAMHDGTETLSEQLILDTYQTYFDVVHDVVADMAARSASGGGIYGDVQTRAVSIKDAVSDIGRRHTGKRRPTASLRPGQPEFLAQLFKHILTLGLTEDEAQELAQKVVAEGGLRDYAHACRKAQDHLKPAKPLPAPTKGKPQDAAANEPDYSADPKDLRNALVAARREGTSVYEQMQRLGMVATYEAYLC